MNEETTLPSEVLFDPEPSVATETDASEVTEASDGALIEATIYEDLSGSEEQETIAGTVITLDDLQSIGSDMVHADLFGSFLVCGTLIGLFLLRGIHGT